MKQSIALNFYKLAKGTGIGVIETLDTSGYIFATKYAQIRIAKYAIFEPSTTFSLSKLPHEQHQILYNLMITRSPVRFIFSTHIIGNPLNGNICIPSYIEHVIELK